MLMLQLRETVSKMKKVASMQPLEYLTHSFSPSLKSFISMETLQPVEHNGDGVC